MRLSKLISLLGLCSLTPGCCSMCRELGHNLFTAPFHYEYKIEDCAAKIRNKKLAEEVWIEVKASCGRGEPFSADYVRGFKDGFVDYMDAGGKGEPPPIPPRKYWTMKYQTPQGFQAIEDWYSGFRHGASVAIEGGYRAYVTVPSSMHLRHLYAVAVGAEPPSHDPAATPKVYELGRAKPAASSPVVSLPRSVQPSHPNSGTVQQVNLPVVESQGATPPPERAAKTPPSKRRLFKGSERRGKSGKSAAAAKGTQDSAASPASVGQPAQPTGEKTATTATPEASKPMVEQTAVVLAKPEPTSAAMNLPPVVVSNHPDLSVPQTVRLPVTESYAVPSPIETPAKGQESERRLFRGVTPKSAPK